jgi:hypothetical protein
MRSLDFDLDSQINNLELEWRQAYESSIVARGDYQALAASPTATADLLDMARERLDRAEALKAQITGKLSAAKTPCLTRIDDAGGSYVKSIHGR